MEALVIIGLMLFVVALVLTMLVVIRAFSEPRITRMDKSGSQVLVDKMNKFVRKDVK